MDLRQQITQAVDVQLLAVDVPEWGCTVHLRQLSVADRLALMKKVDEDQAGKLSVWVLLYTLADHAGQLLFTSEDYDLLAAKSAKVVDRLAVASYHHNGMVGDAVEEAKKN